MDVIRVQYADMVGMGFSRYEPPDEPKVGRAFWDTAHRLLRAEVVQPPASLRSTLGHPIWSLRIVDVDGLGDFWCFAEQGRSGSFGMAGTCRFSFVSTDWHPAEVWAAGARSAAADHPDAPDGPADLADTLPRVLAALAAGANRVPLPGTPAAAATVLAAVLRGVPGALAADRIWSTCPLQLPEPRDHPLVAARWPAEFRQSGSSLGRQLDDLLDRPLPERVADVLPDQRHRDALTWLARHAERGAPDHPDRPCELVRRSAAAGLPELLDVIALEVQPLHWTDVPRALDSAGGKRRLADEPGLVADWARQEPAAALDRYGRERDVQLRAELAMGVVEAQAHTGRNVAGLPLAGTPARTSKKLAALLVAEYPEDDRAAVIARFTVPGGVLADPGTLATLHDWLRHDTHLDPHRHPALFPIRPAVITGGIGPDGNLSPTASAELGRADAPVRDLVGLLPGVGHLAADAAAALTAAVLRLDPADDDEALRDLAAVLAEAAGAADTHGAQGWLAGVLAGLGRRGIGQRETRQFLYGALATFHGHRLDALTDPQLIAVYRQLGAGPDAPAAARALLATADALPTVVPYDRHEEQYDERFSATDRAGLDGLDSTPFHDHPDAGDPQPGRRLPRPRLATGTWPRWVTAAAVAGALGVGGLAGAALTAGTAAPRTAAPAGRTPPPTTPPRTAPPATRPEEFVLPAGADAANQLLDRLRRLGDPRVQAALLLWTTADDDPTPLDQEPPAVARLRGVLEDRRTTVVAHPTAAEGQAATTIRVILLLPTA
ncbi:hypothetical protein GCM10010123_41360 [Pilimelia anulata]|uniref:Uncharacterized protein n=1 Tax=Pilimelia anulata TaxID=53371 RepID=A0A8J3BGZ8_9ACTN|nr:hypothetical protein [Pilimelia anulata]GGK07235.1 hypothetical protein GCM10010123_41360 [Pilimelia anulata]